jgi:hypothetical protein
MKRYILLFLIIAILPGCMPPVVGPLIMKGAESGIDKLLGIDPRISSGEIRYDCEECIAKANVAQRKVYPRITTGTANDYIQEYLREYNLNSDQRRIVEDCLRSKNKGYLGQAE